MKTEIAEYKGRKVIRISGDIDMHSSPALREEMMSIIKKAKNSCIYIDFTEVTYIDSSGIATFVEGLKALKSGGGKLLFFGLPGSVLEIFRFSRLDRVFEIFGTLEDAFRS